MKRGGRVSGESESGMRSTGPSPSAAANPAAPLHPCPDCDSLHEQYRERIRALEAELADCHEAVETQSPFVQTQVSIQRWKARAEKAEAEVERLTEALRVLNGFLVTDEGPDERTEDC